MENGRVPLPPAQVFQGKLPLAPLPVLDDLQLSLLQPLPELFQPLTRGVDLLLRQTVLSHLCRDPVHQLRLSQGPGHGGADDLDVLQGGELAGGVIVLGDLRTEGQVVVDALDAQKFRVPRFQPLEAIEHVAHMAVPVQADVVQDLHIRQVLQALRVEDGFCLLGGDGRHGRAVHGLSGVLALGGFHENAVH